MSTGLGPSECRASPKVTLEDAGRVVIRVGITAQPPKNVPEENGLPLPKKDEKTGAMMRIYVPDIEKMRTWSLPKAPLIERRIIMS